MKQSDQLLITDYDYYELLQNGGRLTRQQVKVQQKQKPIIPIIKSKQQQKDVDDNLMSTEKKKPTANAKQNAIQPNTAKSQQNKPKCKIESNEQNIYQEIEVPPLKKMKAASPQILKPLPLVVDSHAKRVLRTIDCRSERCSLCRFILGSLDYINCNMCESTAHEHCLHRSPGQWLKNGSKWFCGSCQPCSICKCVDRAQDLTTCSKCNAKCHYNCLSAKRAANLCPKCIECSWCKSKEFIERFTELQDGGILCCKCTEIHSRGKYCLICKQEWTFKEKSRDYIMCDDPDCQMWLHRECDDMMANDPGLFAWYVKSGQSSKYRCPKCRQKVRRNMLSDAVRFLSYFDAEKTFWMVDHSNVKYLELVQQPIDFVTIYSHVERDHYQNVKSLFNDVRLAVRNCLSYNLANTRVHRRALFVEQALDLVIPILERAVDLDQVTLSKYFDKDHSLVHWLTEVGRALWEQFLEKATGKSRFIRIIGQVAPRQELWEKQQLAFSSSKPQTHEVHVNELIQFERSINNICFENDKEPLVKFSYVTFSRHLLQQIPQFQIDGIGQILNRTKVVLHPYLKYLTNSHQQASTSTDKSIQEELHKNQHNQINGYTVCQNELQTYFSQLIKREQSKLKQTPPMAFRLQLSQVASLACGTCGGYEHSNNLLSCSHCQETHHFFCQIQQPLSVPMRVLSALQDNIQGKWLCLKCSICPHCNRGSPNQNDLFCSTCSSFYHFRCQMPAGIKVTPEERLEFWRCPDCFICGICSIREIFTPIELSHLKTIQITLDYFNSFLTCLSCGISQTAKRFCDICTKFIAVDNDKDVVAALMAPAALKQFEEAFYKNYHQEETNQFKSFFKHNNGLIQHQSTDQFQQNEQFQLNQRQKDQRCEFCLRYYHSACVANVGKMFTVDGYCHKCILSSQNQMIQERLDLNDQDSSRDDKLKLIQPYLSAFINFNKNGQQLDIGVNQDYLWPQLTEIQKEAILDNIDNFDDLIKALECSHDQIKQISNQIYSEPLSEDTLHKLIEYWFNNFETNSSPEYKEDQYISLQMIVSLRSYILELFPLQYFGLMLDTSILFSELQCNFVSNQVNEQQIRHFTSDYYHNLVQAIGQCQVPLIVPTNNLNRRNPESTKENISILVANNQEYSETQRPYTPFYHICHNLQQRLTHSQIDTKLKELKQLFDVCDSTITQISNLFHQQPKQRTVVLPLTPLQRIGTVIADTQATQVLQDLLCPSPLDMTACYLCSIVGNRSLSGHLLYCDSERWVHANCAVWSDEVKVVDGCVIGLFSVMKVMRISRECEVCQKGGATISCINSNCKRRFHFGCSYRNKNAFLGCHKVVCSSCLVDVQVLSFELQAFAQERSNKCTFLRVVLNEILNGCLVLDFSVFRRLVVMNSNKAIVDGYYRFGNTVLMGVIQQPQEQPLFRVICVLYNRISPNSLQTYHRFLQIKYSNGNYSIRHQDLNYEQMRIAGQQTDDDYNIHSLSPAQMLFDRVLNKTEPLILKSQKDLQTKICQLFSGVGDQDEIVGHALLLFTPFLRNKLQTKVPVHELSPLISSTLQLFFKGGVVEDLQHQTRLAQIQWAQKHIQCKHSNSLILQYQTIIGIIQKRHPALLDLIPIPSLTATQHTLIKRDRFKSEQIHILNQVLSSDILQEAEYQLENSLTAYNEFEWSRELERRIILDYMSIEQNKRKRCLLYVAPSRIHKYGLYTKQFLKQWDLVIEYTGELIRNSVADERERMYIERGFGDCYLFRVTKDHVIDATFIGSQARYLNHSCDPNCASILVNISGQPKILMYTKREIQMNEELTYDYQFEVDNNKLECYCEAKNCLGRLN